MTRRPDSGKRRSRPGGLRARLIEAETTLEAIRRGEVDAVVVSGPDGDRTLTIEGATRPYHVLLHAMSDGAALLHRDGTILFANRRLEEIARVPLEDLGGSRFQQLVDPAEQVNFEGCLRHGVKGNTAREFAIMNGDASATPVWIALSPVPLGAHPGAAGTEAPNEAAVVMAIITDLTERKRAEATRLGLLKRLISAEDEERRRIARELHDEIGQWLTALVVGLRTIEDLAVTTDVQSVAHRLRELGAQSVDNVGRLARGLHPRELDETGLATAVTRHAESYSRSLGIDVDVRLEGLDSSRVSPLVETTMYRIVQEALTNVARHARARVVGVELTLEGTTLELVVRDDGVGFDASTAHEASGLGLHGMQERVALLGGSVELESRPGHGTVVRVRTPVGTPAPTTQSRPRRKRTR